MARWLMEASDFGPDPGEPLGPVLRRWLARSGLRNVSDRERVWEAWQRLLGPSAAATRLEGLRNHVAQFAVESSPLLAELRGFRKAELLEGLQREVRTYFVRDLRLRLVKSRPGGRAPARG